MHRDSTHRRNCYGQLSRHAAWIRGAFRRTLVASGLLLTAAAWLGAQEGPTGVIRGRVLDGNGQAVFGATIQTARIPGLANEAPLTTARAETASDGSFELAKLGEGLYQLCVQHISGTILDPCDWAENPVTVQLNAGGLLEGLTVEVRQAALLRVAIDDPQEVLKAEEEGSKRKLSFLYVAVRTPRGGMRKARLLRTTASGYELGVPVPEGEDAQLFVAGHNLEMKDKDNRDLPDMGQVIEVPKAEVVGTKESPLRIGLARRAQAAP